MFELQANICPDFVQVYKWTEKLERYLVKVEICDVRVPGDRDLPVDRMKQYELIIRPVT